jgi:hypothetical protein
MAKIPKTSNSSFFYAAPMQTGDFDDRHYKEHVIYSDHHGCYYHSVEATDIVTHETRTSTKRIPKTVGALHSRYGRQN